MSQYAAQTTGTLFGAYGSLMSGKQTSDLLKNQADTQTRNANEALVAAKYNADRESLIATKHLGSMQASYAASGVDASSGSVLAVMAASAANAELDRQQILHGGQLRAVNYTNQASLDRLGAGHALQASYFNALSSVVAGGAGMMANSMGGGNASAGNADDLYKTDYSQANYLGEGETFSDGAVGGGAEDATAAIA